MTSHSRSPEPGDWTQPLSDREIVDLSYWAEDQRAAAFAVMGHDGPNLTPEDKADILQDSIHDLIVIAGEAEPVVRSWKAWFFSVVRNKTAQHLRRKGQQATEPLDPDRMPTPPVDDSLPGAIERMYIQTAIGRLNPTYRDPLRMKLGGATYAEIAETFEITVVTARQRISRAVRQVAEQLQDRPDATG